jgi:hypothetical protein
LKTDKDWSKTMSKVSEMIKNGCEPAKSGPAKMVVNTVIGNWSKLVKTIKIG